jgi:hypothetical protein
MKLLLENVRLSFPDLFKARAFNADQEAKFSATFILDKGSKQAKALEDAIAAAVKDKWPKAKPKALKVCLRDGSEKDHLDGFGEDVVFFNASADKRPTVVDRDRSPLTAEDGKPYAGCYVNAMVDVWAQDNQFGKRINCQLMGVQFARDGESFGGGGVAAADDFPALEEGDTSYLD